MNLLTPEVSSYTSNSQVSLIDTNLTLCQPKINKKSLQQLYLTYSVSVDNEGNIRPYVEKCPIIYIMSTPGTTGQNGHSVSSPTPGKYSRIVYDFELQEKSYWSYIKCKPMKKIKNKIILKAYAISKIQSNSKPKVHQYKLQDGVSFNSKKRRSVRALLCAQSIYYNSVNLWTFTLPPHFNDNICPNSPCGKYFYHDQNIYSKAFQYVLNQVKKEISGNFNYVYVAEFQKRGAIHFHLTTPNKPKIQSIIKWWNKQMLKLGHDQSPNSVDLKSSFQQKNTKSKINPFYLVKYLNKCKDGAIYYTSCYGSSQDNSKISKGFSLAKTDPLCPKTFKFDKISTSHDTYQKYMLTATMLMDQSKLSDYIQHYNQLKNTLQINTSAVRQD